MIVIITDPAREDLAKIYAYHAQGSPDRAGRVAGAILHAANLLAEFPQMGRQGSVPGTRERVIGRYPYRIIYRVVANTVEVPRIVHGAQQWP